MKQNSSKKNPHLVADASMLSGEKVLFLQLLKNFPDGLISVVDQQYRFMLTGGELHKRLGVDPKDLIGKEIYPKFPATLREVVINRLKKVFEGEVVQDFDLPEKLKGEYYVMDAFPLVEADGTIAYAGVIIRNVTHLKNAEEELKKALKKEKELGELKSRFVTMASHEFRTPLTTVLSSANILKKYTEGETKQQLEKHIGKIITSVNMLNDILNDFLSLGKIEEGKITARPVRTNIKETIESSIQQLTAMRKEGQEVIYEHTGDEWKELDPALLRHIINNLLSNAIKFSPAKSMVNVSTGWNDGHLFLQVKDQGIGIPEENRGHLFDRFYRASNAVNIQGTGLGLHIVGKYLEMMNAKIDYETELYKGTTFTITF